MPSRPGKPQNDNIDLSAVLGRWYYSGGGHVGTIGWGRKLSQWFPQYKLLDGRQYAV